MMQGRGTEILFYTRKSEKKVPDKVSKEYEKMVRFSGKEPRQEEQRF